MAKIVGSSEYIIDQVRRIVQVHVPGASCALYDRGKRVCCGEVDKSGKLHERRWWRQDLDDEKIAEDAEQLARVIASANGDM